MSLAQINPAPAERRAAVIVDRFGNTDREVVISDDFTDFGDFKVEAHRQLDLFLAGVGRDSDDLLFSIAKPEIV